MLACAIPLAVAADSPPETVDAFDHSPFDRLLKLHVSESGQVDYKSWSADRAGLDAYVRSLGDAAADSSADSSGSWTREDRLAFWINAYNAITVQRILDDYPPKGLGIIHPRISIRNIDGVWDKLTTRVAGRQRTLDQIEHEILRPEFNEPRIHFAIVCASVSCPRLRNEAFVASRIEEQLAAAARDFARDASKNLVSMEKGRVEISAIFDWFAEDFSDLAPEASVSAARGGAHAKLAGGIAMLARYSEPEVAKFLLGGDYKLKVVDYDWGLNGR